MMEKTSDCVTSKHCAREDNGVVNAESQKITGSALDSLYLSIVGRASY